MGCISSKAFDKACQNILKKNSILAKEKIPQENQNQKKVIALYNFKKRSSECLSFKKGQIFYVVDESDPDWWSAINITTNQKGLIPSNFVELYDEDKKVEGNKKFEWYCPGVTRPQAETMLSLCEVPGTFLIRPSTNPGSPYALSVLDHSRAPKHYKITFPPGLGYSIVDKSYFPDLNSLVENYKCTDGLNMCRLIKPVTKTPPEPPGLGKDVWEVDRNLLMFLKKLGSGNYGDVWMAIFNENKKVAVKTLKDEKMKPDDFLIEAALMKKIKHKRLVTLLGVCIVDKPLLIIVEYMENGSLKEYLPKRKTLSVRVLLSMCVQICEGMKYIESINMVHRDLAARNVLISQQCECKIADFGLAMINDENGILGSDAANLPIRWTAPESILHKRFSNKTDVWSFGVVMWEILTFCDAPYEKLTNEEVKKHVIDGNVLKKPTLCPQSLYQLMISCWALVPEERFTFYKLHELLIDEEKLAEQNGGLYNEL